MLRFILLTLLVVLPALSGAKEDRVDEVFRNFTKAGSPGCAVGVLENGATALAKGYGLADVEHNLPLTPASRFYMASVSKQFTAMAALMAQKEGRLSLDDSVRKHIPELPEYAAGITLARMLDHTAGLRDYLALWSLKGFDNQSVLRDGPTLTLVSRQKALDFAPGTSHSYSNTGYFLMSVIIRRATGQTLDEFLRDRLFSPLGMSGTRFQHDHSVPVPGRAHGYRESLAGYRTADVAFDMAGSGGLYSNIEDMLKWARNFEEPKVGAGLLERLQTPGKLTSGVETPGGYALGISRQKRGDLTVISHSGGAVGYTTHFMRVPEARLTVVTLCNGTSRASQLAESVAEVYLDRKLPKAPAVGAPDLTAPPKAQALTAAERRRLAGTYWSEELAEMWRVYESGEVLLAQSTGSEAPVMKLTNGTYRAGPAILKLAGDGEGPVTAFAVETGRAHDIGFVRK